MDRLAYLRAGIEKHHEVLEIGPYFNPIAPRCDGYRVTTVDVFDTDMLRQHAAADPSLGPSAVARIEEVDLIGSACDLADLTFARYGSDRRFDWIVSSHNFEHLPDPIRFLRQCAAVLKPHGVLRMAIPDKRYCFDHYRQVSDVSEWLQAFHERREKPTVYQMFRELAYCSTGRDRRHWMPTRHTLDLYRSWFGPDGRPPDDYFDTHCWAFTPESFELLLHDVQAFGLVPLKISRISEPTGHEFFVDLSPAVASQPFSEDDYFFRRDSLLQRALAPAPKRRRLWRKIVREATRVGRQVAALGSGSSRLA